MQALLIAGKPSKSSYFQNRLDDSELFDACYALLFFGVPNLGLSHEQLRTMAKDQSSERLILDLTVDKTSEPSPYLRKLDDAFRETFIFPDSPVISYFELLPSKTAKV
jgi:hypothetical protein